MDPVSALGVAAAAVQFIQFSLQTLETCRQIRDDAESSTRRNRELEEAAQSVRSARKELEASPKIKTPKRIADVARDCVTTSDDLLDLLKHVRGAGKHISTAKAAYRAIREKRTIEKLENAVRAKQESLNHLLIQGIWTRAELLAVEQCAEFSKLSDRVQSLTKQLIKQKDDVSNALTALDLSVNARFNGLEGSVLQGFEQTERSVEQQSNAIRKHVDRRLGAAENAHQRERFLGSLFFPDMETRESQVSDAAPTTLEWIFGAGNVPSEANWDDFVDWLHGTGTYWICGKAGSGKSTLMAYLTDDHRVVAGLEQWSQGREVLLLRFYFWRAGSKYQNSTVGLLRTLLYQICQHRADLTQTVISHLRITAERMPNWTAKSLLSSINEALHAATDTYFCIFIDGLDEFEGDYAALIDLIFGIRKLANVKFCLSSRPEVQLSTRLNGCKKLFLHDLNRHDIKAFTYQQLRHANLNSETECRLIKQISDAAEGVFLWASLVVRDIIRGLELSDDIETLDARIKSLPGEIEELFATMIEKVDPLHRAHLARYLQIMLLCPDERFIRSISVLTTMTMSADVCTDVDFGDYCAQTERRISGHSAGLLEVRRGFCNIQKAPEAWDLSAVYDADEELLGPPACCRCRVRCGSMEMFSPMFFYESRYMSLIHRSAYDFVKTAHVQKLTGQYVESRPEILTLLCDAALKYMLAVSSCHRLIEFEYLISCWASPMFENDVQDTGARLRAIMRLIASHYNYCDVWADGKLDNIQKLLMQLDPQKLYLCEYWPIPKLDVKPLDLSITTASDVTLAYFWIHCMDIGMFEYTEKRLNDILHRDPQSIAVSLVFEQCGYSLQLDKISTAESIGIALAKSVCSQSGHETQLMLLLQHSESRWITRVDPFRGMSFQCSTSGCQADAIVSRISIITHLVFASRNSVRSLDTQSEFSRLTEGGSTAFLDELERGLKVCVSWYLDCQHLSLQLPPTDWLQIRNYDSSSPDIPAQPFTIRIVCLPRLERSGTFESTEEEEEFSHSNGAESIPYVDTSWGCYKPRSCVILELTGKALELLWEIILKLEVFKLRPLEISALIDECLMEIIEHIQENQQRIDTSQQSLATECIKANLRHLLVGECDS